jgi:hypothetical protein
VSGRRLLIVLAAVALLVPPAALGTADGSTTATTSSDSCNPTGSSGPTSSSAVTPPPDGLIAVQQYTGAAPVFSDAVFNDASIVGVDLRINWNDVQTSPTTCNWGPITETLRQAAHYGKFVALTIVPGFGTPTWLYTVTGPVTTQPTVPKNPLTSSTFTPVVAATFDQQYGSRRGDATLLPVLWDQTYLDYWFAFLQDVSERYAGNAVFRMIAAAGPTSVSSEMSLPRSADDPALSGGSDITRSISLGYTPQLYEGAWRQVFAAYARMFPSQYISLSLFPGLPIGNNHLRQPRQSTLTTKAVLAEGTSLKDHFVVPADGLNACPDGVGIYDLVASEHASYVTGLQLTTSAKNDPQVEACASVHGVPAEVAALKGALANGLDAHVHFLEVYQPDVLFAPMGAALTAAAQLRD